MPSNHLIFCCPLLFLHGEEYLVEGIATQGSVKG